MNLWVQENPPAFSFDTRGFKGGRMIQVKVCPGTPAGCQGGRLTCSYPQDVRDFALHLLADEKAQQWLYVAVSSPFSPLCLSTDSQVCQNKRNLRRVVVLMLPGVTPSTLGIPAPSIAANMPFGLQVMDPTTSTSQLPIFQSLFSHACPTKAPGEKNKMHSCYQAFTTCPLTGGEKTRREQARKESEYLGIDSDEGGG